MNNPNYLKINRSNLIAAIGECPNANGFQIRFTELQGNKTLEFLPVTSNSIDVYERRVINPASFTVYVDRDTVIESAGVEEVFENYEYNRYDSSREDFMYLEKSELFNLGGPLPQQSLGRDPIKMHLYFSKSNIDFGDSITTEYDKSNLPTIKVQAVQVPNILSPSLDNSPDPLYLIAMPCPPIWKVGYVNQQLRPEDFLEALEKAKSNDLNEGP